MKKIYFLVMVMMLLISRKNYAQTYYSMASGDYSKNFDDITNTTAWPNGFNGTSSTEWIGVAVNASGTVPDGVKITTTTTSAFVSGFSGGVQRGDGTNGPDGSIILLCTGTTDNNSAIAIELLLDFTSRTAGTLSFSWASVNNQAVAGNNRNGSLRVYTSTDGILYSELTSAQVLNFTNNTPTSGAITSVSLPSAFNGASAARIRFYDCNGTGGTSGSRPKISIDNVVVTSTGNSVAPSVSASTQAATNAPGQTVNVQSNLAAGKVYVILNGVTQVTQADLDVAVTAHNGASATVSAANTDVPVSASGLTVGTYYAYAVDGSGTVSPKGTNPITITIPVINPPAAPGNLTATSTSITQIDLSWEDKSANEDNFKIETSANGTAWTPLATLNAGITSYSHTGLTEGTLYYYRVYATNGGGNSDYSNTTNVTTLLGPPTVTAVAQTVNNLGQSAKVQSSKASGSVYIILNSIIPATVADMDAAVIAKKGAKAAVTAASSDIPVSALGLNPGIYYAYAANGSSAMSPKGTNAITVTGTVTGTEYITASNLVDAYIIANNLVIEVNSNHFLKASAEIFDLVGRKIMRYPLVNGINTFSPGVKGIFLVKMVVDGEIMVKKIYLE